MVHRAARWRRSVPESSMSSCTRLKLWPSSPAAAPGGAGRWWEPLAADAVGAGEAEVVAHLLVHRPRGLILGRVDEAEDLRLGVGDERLQVRRGQHRNRIPASSMFAARVAPPGAATPRGAVGAGPPPPAAPRPP